MPVEDVNADRLGTDLLNVLNSTSEVSDFWNRESDILVVVAIGLFFLFLAFIIILLGKIALKKALNR